jgi:type IV secretory pathway TrbF-like protein
VSGQAVNQLTTFAQGINPLANLGNVTSSVQINNFNAVSDNSLQFTWTQTTYDNQGQITNQVVYNGLFTLQQDTPPTDVSGVLENPFGLKITYFSMNSEAQQ